MNYFEQHADRFEQELFQLLRIPSVSTLSEHAGDVRRAAEYVAADLRSSGFDNVRLVEKGGNHPLVCADWLHAPGKPVILFYGHYDVQPADPLNEWHTPPFEPTVRNGNVYARGAVDDKGQVWLVLKALESLLKTTGRLPVNVKVLIEGEEEVGGEHVSAYVAAQREALQADAALVCDTEMFAPGLPTICTALRGIVYGELIVEGARMDLHSGVYGGAAPNPLMAIAEILTALKDRDGHIPNPGFLEKVRPPEKAELDAWSRLPFDEAEYLEKEIGAKSLTGEPEFSVLERVWARPTVEVHGIRGGFTGEGAKTVIPARALAKVSMRLVADQSPAEAVAQMQAAVEKACPRGVTARYQSFHSGGPCMVSPENRFVKTAAHALSETFGKETVYIRGGGSIPIVGLFQQHLGIASVLMGFGLPDDNLHAPNEKFHLPNFHLGIRTVARYLTLLGENGTV